MTAKKAAVELTPHPQCLQQKIDGFGTSACWWSPNLENEAARDDIISRLYSKDGLGLRVYRYNVGGGVNPAHERVSNPWRTTESFLVVDETTGEARFDFTRDANAQAALFAALQYENVDTVILFANSPHYSMTVSGESSGGFAPNSSNLREDCYEAFADYFLTVADYFLSRGVPVKLLSPINEPQWKWGGDDVRQEGCHYETHEIVRLLHLFAEKIEARGLPVRLAAPESGEIGEKTREYFCALAEDPVIMRNLGSFAFHSYWADGDREKKEAFGKWFSARDFGGVPLDMTEWCELPNKHDTEDPMAAVIMAKTIAKDLSLTRAKSWTSWVAVNHRWLNPEDSRDYSDAMFTAEGDFSFYRDTFRFAAMGHFSRFVPPGSHCIACDCEGKNANKVTSCAFLLENEDLVLVLANGGGACEICLHTKGGCMEIYTTDEKHRLEQTYAGAVQPLFPVGKESVTTVVIRACKAQTNVL